LRLELLVAVEVLKTARANHETQQIDRLRGEFGMKAFLAQANVMKIVEKFREQTNATIEVATATALQGWSE
jgi:hypothetical protein